MDESTGLPIVVNSASAQFGLGSDNANLRPSDQGVSSPEPKCGDKGTLLVDANGESDESNLVPGFKRRSSVDDICFGGKTFGDCLETRDMLLTRFAECRISISFMKGIFVQPKIDFPSHKVTPNEIQANT
ncbi:hypothetical protein PI125_g12118 [Phytophthora idaei]|nr:hypothetical protein PI125_g12118 [Phytophthora idaei]KAG3134061.1 hypothetical protein PI126_g18867 [Phytophthora idaei]